MKHTFLCRRPQLWSTLIALVVGATSCTLNVAYGAGSAHWQDKVTITGSPATKVGTGQAYSFQPTASGPRGTTLAFSVQNKPSWANFSIATGLLSGTPSSTQTGTYSNIVVSASGGVSSSSLAPFSITVTSATSTTGSATVILTPPTQNTDGTTLTDLAGVITYYGTSPSNLNQKVQVASTTQTSYTITNLASGTWYFGGVAYTTTGLQSAMSSLVSATIP
jgi:Putative Ig domain